MPDDQTGSAVAKAFALLDVLIDAGEPLTAAELGDRLGLPKASVHRILVHLETVRAIQRQDGERRIAVGPRLTALALRALRAAGAGAAIRAVLQRLVAEIGESCNLGVLDGTEVVYLARVECHWALRTHLEAGSRVPLHCTAIGKLVLAHMDAEERRRIIAAAGLAAYTPYTITDPARLEAHLADIRREGAAFNRQEYMLGLIGFGVPILDDDGRMLAGVAIHAPLARVDLEQGRRHLPVLRRAAGELKALLAPAAQGGAKKSSSARAVGSGASSARKWPEVIGMPSTRGAKRRHTSSTS